tara:strand:+ start:569 stop:883 length:315 start_codon:yes stop_codon:yes gene_type:complete
MILKKITLFKILIILLLLSGCGNKQILPSPISELNTIRNFLKFINLVGDEEEIEEEKDTSSAINTSGLVEAERMVIGEDGAVHLMGPKDKEIYFYKRDVWIAGE